MPNPTSPILSMAEMNQGQQNAYLIFNEAIRTLEVQLGRGFTAIINDGTGTHVLESGERGAYVRMTSATAQTFEVPEDTILGIDADDPFTVHVRWAGDGVVTIIEPSGVTINASTLELAAQFDTVTLIHIGADEWDMIPGSFGEETSS